MSMSPMLLAERAGVGDDLLGGRGAAELRATTRKESNKTLKAAIPRNCGADRGRNTTCAPCGAIPRFLAN
eukprot:scaffold1087_cov198-Pinguiococcus_pyrenoidosus.AAC.35